jgi:predicted DNA binding CopG/RHH family protein
MKKLPKFKNENAERAFWAKNSPLDFMGAKKLRLTVFPHLKTTSRTISIRLPEPLLESIKIMANKRDVPYQSMVKMLLAEAVREEQATYVRRKT